MCFAEDLISSNPLQNTSRNVSLPQSPQCLQKALTRRSIVVRIVQCWCVILKIKHVEQSSPLFRFGKQLTGLRHTARLPFLCAKLARRSQSRKNFRRFSFPAATTTLASGKRGRVVIRRRIYTMHLFTVTSATKNHNQGKMKEIPGNGRDTQPAVSKASRRNL